MASKAMLLLAIVLVVRMIPKDHVGVTIIAIFLASVALWGTNTPMALIALCQAWLSFRWQWLAVLVLFVLALPGVLPAIAALAVTAVFGSRRTFILAERREADGAGAYLG